MATRSRVHRAPALLRAARKNLDALEAVFEDCRAASRARRAPAKKRAKRRAAPKKRARVGRAPAAATDSPVDLLEDVRAELGKSHPTFGYGARKVYIAPVVAAVARRRGVPEEDVRRALVAGHRAGRLSLSRADLAPAMDRDLVRRSEVPYMHATFHFINRDGDE